VAEGQGVSTGQELVACCWQEGAVMGLPLEGTPPHPGQGPKPISSHRKEILFKNSHTL